MLRDPPELNNLRPSLLLFDTNAYAKRERKALSAAADDDRCAKWVNLTYGAHRDTVSLECLRSGPVSGGLGGEGERKGTSSNSIFFLLAKIKPEIR